MNEIIYVSDIDSGEMIYMNRKGREIYGVQSVEALKGKTCYEIFQEEKTTCEFCRNDKLRPGYFEEWQYFDERLGKYFGLKATMLEEDGKRYRMGMAFDISAQMERHEEVIAGYISNEAMINEALRRSLAAPTAEPEESLEALLEYLGETLHSERSYIFEKKKDGNYRNTYEWCAKGVSPQIDNLQAIPPEAVQIWLDRFRDDRNVVIEDLEGTKEEDPIAYEYLSPQDIRSLVVGPLLFKDEIIGFYGVDNPPQASLENISTLFRIMGHFIVSILRRRNLVEQLKTLSFYDQLTGCKNRHAMDVCFEEMQPESSVGVIYGDVTGLKKVNDTLGHSAGDQLLIQASECLKRVVSGYELFRIGGDEFLVICNGITEAQLLELKAQVKMELKKHSVVMAIGSVWRPDSKGDMDKLLAIADEQMYIDKNEYYAGMVKGNESNTF